MAVKDRIQHRHLIGYLLRIQGATLPDPTPCSAFVMGTWAGENRIRNRALYMALCAIAVPEEELRDQEVLFDAADALRDLAVASMSCNRVESTPGCATNSDLELVIAELALIQKKGKVVTEEASKQLRAKLDAERTASSV